MTNVYSVCIYFENIKVKNSIFISREKTNHKKWDKIGKNWEKNLR